MQLNMNDPDSIVTWWRVYPERHWAYIEYFASHATPEFRAAIQEAQQRIQADPRFVRCRHEARRAVEAAASRLRPGEDAVDAESGIVLPDETLEAASAWH
jgi:hypothetical protein